MTELESLATTSDEHTHKLQESYGNKLKTLESQVPEYFLPLCKLSLQKLILKILIPCLLWSGMLFDSHNYVVSADRGLEKEAGESVSSTPG